MNTSVNVISARPLAPHWLVLVPNLLSGTRLALAILLPFVAREHWLWMITVAGLTDLFDGMLARRWNVCSWQGGLLDAIADKAFVLSALLCVTVSGTLMWYESVLMLSRDLAVVGLAILVASAGGWSQFRQMPSRLAGKAATLALFVVLITALVMPESWKPMQMVVWSGIAVSLLAAVDYLWLFVQRVRVAQTAHDADDLGVRA